MSRSLPSRHIPESGDWGKGCNGVMEYFWMWLVVPVLLLPGRIPIMLRLKLQSLGISGSGPRGQLPLSTELSLKDVPHRWASPIIFFFVPYHLLASMPCQAQCWALDMEVFKSSKL